MRILLALVLACCFTLGCSGNKKEAPVAQKGEACKAGTGLGPSSKGNCAANLVCSPIKKVCVDESGLRNELR